MDVQGLLMTLVIGGIAGWLAGIIMEESGRCVLINVIVGVLGAVLGKFLLSALGISFIGGFIGTIAVATLGAVILISLLRLIRA